MKTIIPFEIRQKEFFTDKKYSLREIFKTLADGFYDLTILKHKNTRSEKQNRYYWSVVIPFIQNFRMETMGESISDQIAHHQFKDAVGFYTEEHILDMQASTKEGKYIYRKERVYKSLSNMGDINTIDFMNAVEIFRTAMIHLTHGRYELPLPINKE